MKEAEHYFHFFKQRWPNGFECPRCGYDLYYTISTRRMPLYQCRFCKHQTSLTAGTVMDGSRTPLSKWASAFALISSTSSINAVQLSAAIGVSHKVAWTMLRRVRQAISRFEQQRKLQGTVHAGLRCLGPYVFLPSVRYRRERVVYISGSVNAKTGEPDTIAMRTVPPEYLDGKRFTPEGAALYRSLCVDPNAVSSTLLTPYAMSASPLKKRFEEASSWLNRLFRGLGTTYLQSYLDEYCFRWNLASSRLPNDHLWNRIFFGSHRPVTT